MTHTELAELSERIEEITQEKERFFEMRRAKVQEQREAVLHTIKLAEAEYQRRLTNPNAYPIGAGAGTIIAVAGFIEALKKEEAKLAATKVEEEENDYDQAIDDLKFQRGQVLFTMATEIGIEKLRDTRRELGKAMSKCNRLQKEAYDLQKKRYETCKKGKGFTAEDREFISLNQRLNTEFKDKWEELRQKRDHICDLIEELDHDDPDLGWDEKEDDA